MLFGVRNFFKGIRCNAQVMADPAGGRRSRPHLRVSSYIDRQGFIPLTGYQAGGAAQPPHLRVSSYIDRQGLIPLTGYQAGGRRSRHPCGYPVILTTKFNPNIHIQAFADDVTAVVWHKSLDTLATDITGLIEKIGSWCSGSKLSLASEKTSISLITRKIRPPVLPQITVNGNVIPPVDQMKILGVIIDRKLDFRPHLRYAMEKSMRIFKQVVGMARSRYGLAPKIVKMLYDTILVPTLTYAVSAWSHAVIFKYIEKELRRFQRPWAHLITKSYRTASFIATTAIADTPPLHLQMKFLANVTLAKIGGNYPYDGQFVATDVVEDIEVKSVESLNIFAGQPLVRSRFHIFTKIIKKNSGIGCCFTVMRDMCMVDVQRFRLPPYCSMLQADHFIVLQAITWGQENCFAETPITVTSNNIGAIKHLKRRSKKISNLAREIVNRLTANITIAWLKIDNEDQQMIKTKKIAKRTSTSNLEFSYRKIPMTYVKKDQRKIMLAAWNQEYMNDKFGRTVKSLFQTVDQVRKFSPYISFWLTQGLTGHGQFGQYLKEFGFASDASCQCGHQEQSVRHLRFECPLAAFLRRDYATAKSMCMSPEEHTRMEAVLYEQLAMLANQLRGGIHR
ncbi:hypothetical protein DERF_004739 [Dermatophagoides farinae]|uniref:Uncharacterized protein n=1 Tax=Dermatophagoides farinae TaxID=6954 RepID=A0A922I4C3_DERFA|nr:hypothetical protein DERF_004739 [Dermatophagoides farinae]